MLRCLPPEVLAVLVFGDDLYCVILSYRPVEIMPESFVKDRRRRPEGW
jgi:hypothetical protein